jgi:hypothetical protein
MKIRKGILFIECSVLMSLLIMLPLLIQYSFNYLFAFLLVFIISNILGCWKAHDKTKEMKTKNGDIVTKYAIKTEIFETFKYIFVFGLIITIVNTLEKL